MVPQALVHLVEEINPEVLAHLVVQVVVLEQAQVAVPLVVVSQEVLHQVVALLVVLVVPQVED